MAADVSIDLDAVPPAPAIRHWNWRRLLLPSTRRTAATAGLTAIITVLATQAVGDTRVALSRPPAAVASGAQQWRPHAQLIAPATATAGEHLIILAFRDTKLCGSAEVLFDGAVVAHKVIRSAGGSPGTYPQFFMSMEVPRHAKPGPHMIELLGPVRSIRGAICADSPERQARLATTVISVGAPAVAGTQ